MIICATLTQGGRGRLKGEFNTRFFFPFPLGILIPRLHQMGFTVAKNEKNWEINGL
jgi:hypothetical protein